MKCKNRVCPPTYGYNSDSCIQQKHQKLVVCFLLEVELILLFNVEIVDIGRRVDGKGTGSSCHCDGKGLLAF